MNIQQNQITGKVTRVSKPEPSRIVTGTSGGEAMAGAQGVWPIGSVFVGNVSTNPGTLFGFGTWSAVDSGVWMSIGSVDMYIWQRTA